jgi:integrase
MRLAEVETGRFGLRRDRGAPTFRQFVEGAWRQEVAIGLKPSTRDGYEWCLRKHLLPYFGDDPLTTITRAAVKAFIAKKAKQQKESRSLRNPNPNRATLSYKSIRNIVACLCGIMESAATDYEMLPGGANPLACILRRRNFPPDMRPRPKKDQIRVLEPEDFRRVIGHLESPVLEMVLVAGLAGLRWGELIALRVDEDIDAQRSKISISKALYNELLRRRRQRRVFEKSVCAPQSNTSSRIESGKAVLRSRQTGKDRFSKGPGSNDSGAMPRSGPGSRVQSVGTTCVINSSAY